MSRVGIVVVRAERYMTEAGWFQDPAGRHEQRYWDGAAWTAHVADAGQQTIDDDGFSPAGPASATFTGYQMTVEVSEHELVIRRVGIVAKAVRAEVAVPLAALVGVRFKDATPFVNGHLQLVLADDPDPQPGVPMDPYTIVFRRKQQPGMAELRDLLQVRIDRSRAEDVDTSRVEVDRVVGKMQEKVASAEARQAAARGGLKDTGDRFAGVTLRNGLIESPHGGGPVAGARATVDAAGELSKRFTVTRLALTGPLALGLPKKQDHRELYLLIEGEGWAFSVPVNPKKGAEARAFAARINAAGSPSSAQAAGSSPPPTPEAADPIEQLRALATLRDEGVITLEDFEAKKRDLLGRV